MNRHKGPLLIFLRGLLMGTADSIPGISGGTIALITGIYERLVGAIDDITTTVVAEIAKRRFRKAGESIKRLDYALFVPLLSGIVIALFTFAHILGWLIVAHEGVTYAFFFGLILASAWFLHTQSGNEPLMTVPLLAVGAAFAYWLVGLEAIVGNHSPLAVVLAGMLAICAMILPGISGAYLLVLLGQYEYMMAAVRSIDIPTLLLFKIGTVVGILSFSRLLKWLLKGHRHVTLAFLTGLMLGSLRVPAARVLGAGPLGLGVIAAALAGFALVILLENRFAGEA
ncbi:DUF368 domain-containing protein [Candidatus Woesearchaeota archaeon]|nr:DUF368 domain-containing protein [Candidatus Woesearchaeota archaeon]